MASPLVSTNRTTWRQLVRSLAGLKPATGPLKPVLLRGSNRASSRSFVNRFGVKSSVNSERYLYSRTYSTAAPPEEGNPQGEEGKAPAELSAKEKRIRDSIAAKYGFDPRRDKEFAEWERVKDLPFIAEDKKKYIRHKVLPNGKYVFPSMPLMTLANLRCKKHVVIAGANGIIAQALQVTLEQRGHVVYRISRMPMPQWPFTDANARQWYQIMGEEGIPDCDALVQLTGHSYLAKDEIPSEQWNKLHFETRSGISELLAEHLPRTKFKPLVFIQGSHAGIYPASDTATYTESYKGPFGKDLIGRVSEHYEERAKLFEDMGIRTVQMRLGHVLGPAPASLLHKVQKIDQWGRFWWSRIGSGEQWFPWIHMADACNMMAAAIENEFIKGPVNCVAPRPIQQKEFAQALKSVLPSRSFTLPMTETAINWMYPHRAHFLLEGRRVEPRVAQDVGFDFAFPDIHTAMDSLQDELIPIRWKNPSDRYFDPKKPLTEQ